VAEEATESRSGLLAELHAARKKVGLTQMQVATFLKCTQGKINKMETGKTKIRPKDLDALLHIYKIPEEERPRFRALTAFGGPAVPAGAGPDRTYLKMLALELQATRIRVLHSERIPKLLQCEKYLLTQYLRAGNPTDPSMLLADHEDRTRVLTRDDPALYRAILSESSLRRMPGGRRDILIDQAKHLIDLSEACRNLSVHILPFDADIPFLNADVTLLDFADDRKPVSYVEHGTVGILTDATKAVTEQEQHWNMLHEAALAPAESTKFLENLMTQAELGRLGARHD
jgi:transcriptional regulator with XRE-family HTH domain